MTYLLDGDNVTVYDRKNKVVKQVKTEPTADPTNTVSASGIEMDALHVKDFFECIRTGKQPNSPIEEGHKSVAMLHLGNIAWRVRREAASVRTSSGRRTSNRLAI